MSVTNYGDFIGAKHLEAPPQHALIEVEIRPVLCNRAGHVHGGVIMSLMDVAGCWAGVPWNAESPAASTVSFFCGFLNAANGKKISKLYAHAAVDKMGKSLYFSSMTVTADIDGPIVASGQGVYRKAHQ